MMQKSNSKFFVECFRKSHSYKPYHSFVKKNKLNNRGKHGKQGKQEKNSIAKSNKNYDKSVFASKNDLSWKKIRMFTPRNDKQEEYLHLLLEKDPAIVVAVGPAGTSKTMGATLVGLELLMKNQIDRLVLTRPAVSADEELGFLKGDLQDKMRPWLLPIYDTLCMYMNHEEIEMFMKSKSIEICSLSHMRGRTFHNCFVVVDESQNTTISQMLMLLTRIGDNSKFVFTGDLKQHDRYNHNFSDDKREIKTNNVSGLADFVERYNKNSEIEKNGVKIIEFQQHHVERHPIIPYILNLYNEK